MWQLSKQSIGLEWGREARLKGSEESQGWGKRGVGKISKMVYGNARNRKVWEREKENNREWEREQKRVRESNREWDKCSYYQTNHPKIAEAAAVAITTTHLNEEDDDDDDDYYSSRLQGAAAWGGGLGVRGEVMFKRISTLPCTKFNLIHQWEKQPPSKAAQTSEWAAPIGGWRCGCGCAHHPPSTGEGKEPVFYLLFFVPK